MRRLSRLLLLSLALFVAAPVLAQGAKGPPPSKSLRDFKNRGPLAPQADSGGIKPFGIAVLVVLGGGLFLGMVIWYKRQAQDLGLPTNEAALASEGPAGAVGVSPQEKVFGAVSRAEGWVTPGRVALTAGMPADEVQMYLDDLIRDGRVKAGRDKQGRVLYRLVA